MPCDKCDKEIQKIAITQEEISVRGTKERIIRGEIIPCDDCPYLKEIDTEVEDYR